MMLYHSNKAYVTYVCPILEYAYVIWSPYHLGEIAKLFKDGSERA